MRQKLNRLVLALAFAVLASGLASRAFAQSPAGTWTLFPQQTAAYSVSVRAPVKADGSSIFKVGRGIPLRFNLSSAPSTAKFESVWSNNFPDGGEGEHDDDFAYASFAPSSDLTFDQITTLKADYEFTTGNCGGGSLRWSVTFDINNDDNYVDPDTGETPGTANDRSIFIYYGDYPNFGDCSTGANDQSGVNMIGLSDLRYDTSQLGGTFYDSYANAQNIADGDSETPPLRVVSVSLVLDSGWMQDESGAYRDQKVNLASATVNENTFVPQSGVPATTCDLPTARIVVVEDTNGSLDDVFNTQRKFADNIYRETNACTYMYNLDSNTLFGAGDYKAYVIINNVALESPARFKLRP